MANERRVDLHRILADPDLRRELMVPTIQATQAREGVETTREQAERAYYVVSEGEHAAFFRLRHLSNDETGAQREQAFVESLRDKNLGLFRTRFDVARQDFAAIESSPLLYAQVGIVAAFFREHARLGQAWAHVRGGMNSTESERFVRHRWEARAGSSRKWVNYSKGGSFARFYADLDLVFDWTSDGADFRATVKEKYGSESRFVKSPEFYFRRGLTWTEKSSLGFSVRILEAGAIFNVAGPAAFPLNDDDEWFLLAILNSYLMAYTAWALSGRNYGASYIAALPVAKPSPSHRRVLGELAGAIHEAKGFWDEGNEISTRFKTPYLLRNDLVDGASGLLARLDRLAELEVREDAHIQKLYAELNSEVYKLYGVSEPARAIIEETLGEQPLELIWPQMEGKSVDQKRMEHVFRLLSYVVKRVVEAADDGIASFTSTGSELSLINRVHHELSTLFPGYDVNQVEIDITNELKKSVKGYRKTDGIQKWLEEVFFDYHRSLYKNRPIIWHIASNQGTQPSAFGALVQYHKFDRNRMAKLRAQYVRDAMEHFRREAALALKEGRSEERVEWQARVEEAQEFDGKLQLIQEGHHEGPEGGERDFRILTPWKSAAERPRGWDPDIDDGVKINIEPLQKAGVLRVGKVV